MKCILLLFTSIFILFNIDFSYGQSLNIIRGNTTKSLAKDRLLEIKFTENIGTGDCEFCASKTVLGTIKKITNDSITLLINEFSSYSNTEELKSTSSQFYHKQPIAYSLPKEGIFLVKDHKNEKVKKRKRNFFTIGGIFLLTGIMSTTSAFFVSEKSDRSNVVYYGAGQAGLGVVLMLLNAEKKYDLRRNKPRRWYLKK